MSRSIHYVTSFDPQEGDGVTARGHTDRKAFTVIKRTKKTVVLQRDKATLLNGVGSGERDSLVLFSKGGFLGTVVGKQRYGYELDPEGEIVTFRLTTKKVGPHGDSSTDWRSKRFLSGLMQGRHEYYDYNF